MKPPAFEYHCPRALEETLLLLETYAEDAKILAGGQSLLPMLNFRLAAPAHLIDINRVAELDALTFDTSGCRVGATVRQREVERAAPTALSYPMLRKALEQVAHVQIRNRGTVCGSLAHADAAAELPTVMVALEAKMIARSKRGERIIPAESFFEFHLGTALEPDELLVGVQLPPASVAVTGNFLEVARRAGDFALVGAAVRASFDDDQRVSSLRIVCSGVAPVPCTLGGAAAIAIGSELSDEVLLELDQEVRAALDPPADVHASSAYRRVVAGTLVRRALAELREERKPING